MHDFDTTDQSDLAILTGTRAWVSTPHDYSSLRCITFTLDGRGEAIYGYGQTIYAKVDFEFELSGDSILRFKYLPSKPMRTVPGFDPTPENAEKSITYTLVRGEYRGVESVVAQPYLFSWLLTLSDSPWPTGMTFPYEVPTSFYGYRNEETGDE